MRAKVSLSPFLLVLLAQPARGSVEGDAPAIQTVRTGSPPVIDGSLDDAAWASAPVAGAFTQRSPSPGAAPSEATELRVLHDDRALYVGLRMHDAAPDEIVARLTRRDRDVETDWVAVHIDSRHDHTSAYVFRISAAGVQSDGQILADGDYRATWDAVWEGAASRDAGGWSAELMIPLAVLRFGDDDSQTWGFQAERRISRRQEVDVWTYWPATLRGSVSRFGHLVGLEALRPRRTFEVRPFVVSRSGWTHPKGGFIGSGTFDGSLESGLDLKLGLTSGLTLDATVNPDFGQVEADAVVLNLTRFEVLFPEKRPFFLEGMEVFASPLFYSRRIGQPTFTADTELVTTEVGPQGPAGQRLDVERAPAVPILAAAKVSGQIAPGLTGGFLGAVTAPEVVEVRNAAGVPGDFEVAPARSFAVLRALHAFGAASHAGVTATAVNRLGGDAYLARANHDAYVQGVDTRWQSDDGVWRAQVRGALSERVGGTAYQDRVGAACPDPSADPRCTPITRQDGSRQEPGDVGYQVDADASWQATRWGAAIETQRASTRYDSNDLFFDPDAYNRNLVAAEISHRRLAIPDGPVRAFRVAPDAWVDTTVGGVVKDWGSHVHWVAETRGFTTTQGFVGVSYPGRWDIYETGDGARFERRPNASVNAALATDSRRKVVGEVSFDGAADLDRDQYQVSGGVGLTLLVHPQLELALRSEAGLSPRQLRFYSCLDEGGTACSSRTVARDYLFARLRSTFGSVTLRGSWTFLPTLSLQAYTQLFAARLRWSGFREVTTDGTHPFIHFDDLAPTDFDGRIDDSDQVAIHGNLILRWEFKPGSTLIAVYTRAQQHDRSDTGLFGIGNVPAEDVVLLKLTLFYR